MSTDLHDLLAPYALDALSPEEHLQFEAHLEHCSACREELAGFAATAGMLGESTARPAPPELRARLLETISSTPQERPTVVALRPRSALRRALPGVVAAVALAIGGVGVGGYVWEREQVNDLRAEASRYEQVMTASDASRTAADLESGGSVTMIRSEKADAAVILASGLAKQPDGVYQLWSMKDGKATSRGVFEATDMVLLDRISAADGLAITVEPVGGSDQPTTTPIATMDV